MVTPRGDGPDAVLACRADAEVEAYFAATAEGFAEEIVIVRQHLRAEEVPQLARIPRWMVEA
jgi:hypothetical protein